MYTLIIVDDDELIRKGLEKVIQWEQMGFFVKRTFRSAVEALEYLKDNPVDVILTDIRMPQMSGLELIQEAKGYQEQVKAVIISGYGEFELAKQALVLKVEDYLLKPLGQEEVEAVFLKLKRGLDQERQAKSSEEEDLERKQKADRDKRRSNPKAWKQVEALTKQVISSLEQGQFYDTDRQVKELERQSFKAYLVKVRMEKARFLLLSRNYRIYEIAQMTGYKNPRYFTDAFKKYYQCSPADYLARFRGKEEG